jgi:aminopeptidase N
VTDVGGAPLDVGSKMDSWLYQIGYPLIQVDRDYNEESIVVNQEKYNPYGLEQPESPYE